jgi:uncharacterized sulfatase
MDEQLGVLFDYIRGRETLRDNTLILVCSDNGPERGAGSAGPLRGYKTWLYEGGIRSSLIAWGPGVLQTPTPGKPNLHSFFAAIDLPPTLLAIADIRVPDDVHFDGHALPNVLLGKVDESRPSALFFRRPPDRKSFYGNSNLPDLAVRDRNWKLLCDYDGSRPQLYNLDTDRGEMNNVAGDHPELVKDLSQRLLAWHRKMPADNGANFRVNGAKRKPKKTPANN